MNKKILGIAFTAGALILSSGAQAVVNIDDFSVDAAFTNASGTTTSALGASSDFSASRTIAIEESPVGPGGASYIITGGELGISTGFATGSNTTLTYANAAGFDFSATETGGGSVFDAFFITLLTIDQGGVDITLTVDGVSATQFVNTAGDILFAHALFGDVSNVNDIEYLINNKVAVDATFDSFGSFGADQVVVSVPEPTSLALLGMGLAAFGFGRRKAK